MLDTLKQYKLMQKIPRLTGLIDLTTKIGDMNSQFYRACYAITKVMLLGEGVKRRCVIFHGEPDSGKTWISKFMREIFESHWKQETKSIFDEKISQQEANKQLLIMNEADME